MDCRMKILCLDITVRTILHYIAPLYRQRTAELVPPFAFPPSLIF
jgi:hypothetical protein